jgi:hypothetical protein
MGAIRNADAAIDEETDAVKNLAAGAAPKNLRCALDDRPAQWMSP